MAKAHRKLQNTIDLHDQKNVNAVEMFLEGTLSNVSA